VAACRGYPANTAAPPGNRQPAGVIRQQEEEPEPTGIHGSPTGAATPEGLLPPGYSEGSHAKRRPHEGVSSINHLPHPLTGAARPQAFGGRSAPFMQVCFMECLDSPLPCSFQLWEGLQQEPQRNTRQTGFV